ncbi:adenosine deaminase [Pseudoalteromonas luteoviolacea]|uniref:Adenosine deaminase n=1 Tax=Pseudoalteromonas luteoviolacea TaxID=43657 RepID=A0A1C0TWY0_9GAMM|nr:adenosine deaminase [Pseudoalteromonas luteoviolacea]MBQ4810331.1 adenosine deaminase [Pseudoalteromonas luteoviolacea]OCQ23821.1 adenosine deaminase [Pseudoalteromonas luteoviolacea]
MKLTSVLAGAAILTLSGCSTILTDDYHRINVSSTKQGLQVEVDGNVQTAPGVVEVKKENKNKTLNVTTQGCEQAIALNKEVEPTFFVNLLSGGAFGSTTDYSSEKMWRYQDSVSVVCPN